MASDGQHMVFHNTSESNYVVHGKKDALTTTEILSSEDIIITKLPDQGNRYQYEHKFNIKSVYRKAIIGPRLSILSAETNTLIKIPLPDTELVMILGINEESIKHARYQIDELVKRSKGKLPFTHFISIPTNTTEIKENFNKFKDYALNCCNARGLKEGMFVEPETLHLTLTMISAVEDYEKEKSLEAFSTCEKDIINSIIGESGPITIELRGVKSMNSNPAKTKVLYIEIHEETGYLKKITDKIFNYFLKQGLTRREYYTKLFHLTIINTRKLKDETQLFVNHTFDARDLLQTYNNAFFGKVELSNLHLSELGSRAEDGYYKAIAILDVTRFQNQKDNNINI